MNFIPPSTGLGDIILCLSYCVENNIEEITFTSSSDYIVAKYYLDYFDNPPIKLNYGVDYQEIYKFIPYTETKKLLKSKYQCFNSDKIFANFVIGEGTKMISEDDANFLIKKFNLVTHYFSYEHKKKNNFLIDSKLCITTEGGCAWHAHVCGVPTIIIRKDNVFRDIHERLAYKMLAWCNNVGEVVDVIHKYRYNF